MKKRFCNIRLITTALLSFLFFILITGCKSTDFNKSKKESESYRKKTSKLIKINENESLSELEKITSLKEKDLLQALWKCYLSNDKNLFDECLNLTVIKCKDFYDSGDFVQAYKFYNSLLALNSLGYECDLQVGAEEIQSAFLLEVPAFMESEKKSELLPVSIADCVNATVTIWVDKGLKIENGAGMIDVVIGSGFFIDKRGYIVTNHHVISDLVDPKYEGFSRLYVKLASDTDTKIPAKLIGYDPILDLALLKVEIDPPFILELGSSSDLSVGDKISAIGTPLGLEGTLTSGIISSVDRKLSTMGNVFQLDAAVNSGNSGGPLIDTYFKVQAIVFAGMLRFQGLNFAIPVEYLKTELPFLFEGGELEHSWICAYGHTKRKGKEKVGLEVQYVMSGGVAAQSGLLEDDVIVEIQGKPITCLEDFQNMLMHYLPGSLLSCKYIRGEEEFTTLLYLDKRPLAPAKLVYETDLLSTAFIPLFGIKMIPSSTISSKSFRIEKVIKGTTADEMGFSENDQIYVREVKFDKNVDYAVAQVNTKRRKKGFLDVTLTMGTALDSPYYF